MSEKVIYFRLIEQYLKEHHICICYSSKTVHIAQTAAASTPLSKLDGTVVWPGKIEIAPETLWTGCVQAA